ncbi:MAG TPA: glycosyltransferase family 2 protein [Acetobacteraceae bacterium]|nr:glycosyltransferase family 2 protein [Acetobacteraceae bacterium]
MTQQQITSHTLTSVHGGSVQALLPTGCLWHALPSATLPARDPVLLIRSSASALAILTTGRVFEGTLLIERPEWRQPIHLVRVRPMAEATRVAISLAATRGYLCAPHLDVARGAAEMVCNRIQPQAWEMFTPSPTEGPLPAAPALAACLGWLGRHAPGGRVEGAAVIALIGDEGFPERAALLRAVLPLLSLADMQALGRALLESAALVAALGRIFPDDVWATQALPDLVAWDAARRGGDVAAPPPEPRAGMMTRLRRLLRPAPSPVVSPAMAAPTRSRTLSLGPQLGFLADAGMSRRVVSFGHAANAYARRQVVPRERFCVVTTARNEGMYLVEWVAYYRGLGFNRLFVYSNDNTDGSDELLRALSAAGLVTWIPNEVAAGGNAQGKAYGHAFSMSPEILDYEWVLVVDLDEYLVLNLDLFTTLHDFVDWHETREVEAIAFNWVFLGSSGSDAWRDAPVTRRFRNQIGGPNAHIKSMFRPHKALHAQPHFPRADERSDFVFHEANGTPHASLKPAFSDQPDDRFACLYHYFYKSTEELLWKFSRNRGDHPTSASDLHASLEPAFLDGFLHQHEKPEPDVAERVIRCSPALEADMARILDLPGVRAAREQVRAHFIARSARVKEMYRGILVERWGENGARLLRFLDGGQEPA